MDPNETGVNESGSPAEGSEQHPPESAAPAEGAGSSSRENHIPISRAEEMWKKREEKLIAEFRSKELDPLKKQFEDQQGKLVNGQLAWLKSMGWYNDEPEKPLTRAELQEMMKTEREQTRQAYLSQIYEDRIRAGWEQVSTKYPQLANNKRFQESALASYAQNPNIPLVAHAEAIVKDLLDPYHTQRATALQEKRDEQNAPHRRIVPSGRGAGGGTGSNKEEKKKTMAERIRDRLGALKEQ